MLIWHIFINVEYRRIVPSRNNYFFRSTQEKVRASLPKESGEVLSFTSI